MRFNSATGRPIDVRLKSAPPEATCRLERKGDAIELTATIALPTEGLWQKNIVVIVASGSHEEEMAIPCSGLGKRRVETPGAAQNNSK